MMEIPTNECLWRIHFLVIFSIFLWVRLSSPPVGSGSIDYKLILAVVNDHCLIINNALSFSWCTRKLSAKSVIVNFYREINSFLHFSLLDFFSFLFLGGITIITIVATKNTHTSLRSNNHYSVLFVCQLLIIERSLSRPEIMSKQRDVNFVYLHDKEI
jgi:hypothetical protein